MKRHERRSDCPVNFALQTFGDAWSLLIIRDLMFTDRRTYGDFAGAEESIATNVLAARLKQLRAAGLVRRRRVGGRFQYALTQKGLDLLPTMLELITWSARHDKHTGAPPGFVGRARRDRAAVLKEMTARLKAEFDL
jgi:DNA-binding HxlR family transcriptional regulator